MLFLARALLSPSSYKWGGEQQSKLLGKEEEPHGFFLDTQRTRCYKQLNFLQRNLGVSKNYLYFVFLFL